MNFKGKWSYEREIEKCVMERSYNNPEYIKYIKNNIKHAKDIYICVNCFDTKERKVKKESIVRTPKRTSLFRECDGCCYNKKNKCEKCRIGDTLGISDYDEIPLTHRCEVGRRDKNGRVISMSELCCPVCYRPVHRIIGEHIIISIIGSRDSGKSHYIGVLIHELVNNLAQKLEWTVLPEENTMRMYDNRFNRIYTANQVLDLTEKNYNGYFDPYIFYITDKKEKLFTLTFFDTAGEDFESSDLMENSAKHAFHASGIIFLIDPLKIMNVYTSLNEEIVSNSSSVKADRAFQNDVILSILSTSLRYHNNIRETKKISIPLGIVVPKLDVVAHDFPPHYASLFPSTHVLKQGFSEVENRRVNTEIHKWLASLNDGALNSFMAQLEMNYSNFSYFGVSALGIKNSPDRNGFFSTPMPHRVEDPLLWILKEKGFIKSIK